MKNEDFSTAVDEKQITCKDYEDREFTLKNGKEYRNQSADACDILTLLSKELQLSMNSNIAKLNELKKIKGDLQISESTVKHFREQALKNENLLLESQEKIKTLTDELNQSKLAKDATGSSSVILKDLETLKVEIQESEKKVKEWIANKEEMSEAIKKEWGKKIQIDEENERHKDEAFDKLKEYYSNLRSDSIKLEREKAAKNLQHLKQKYEARDKKLMDFLTEVKMLNMNVCKENNRLIAELKVEKNKLKESRDKEINFEVETSTRKLSEEISKLEAERANQKWEKEQTIKFQENVLAKAKKMLRHFQTGKISDSAENVINANLEYIKDLEARVKETEGAFRKHFEETERKRAIKLEGLKSLFARSVSDQTKDLRIQFDKKKAALKNKMELMATEFKERKLAENLLEIQDLEKFTKLRTKYEDIVSRVTEECKARLEAKDSEHQRLNREQSVKYQKERNSLLNDIESLKEKFVYLENHKTSFAWKFQLELITTKLELEECKSKLEQTVSDRAILRAKASTAEEVSDQMRLQLEALTIKYKDRNEKYEILKERAKKHDRFIHRKTKEYPEIVAKMNAAYQSILNKIINEKIATEDNEIVGSNNQPRTHKMFPDQPRVQESEVEMLKQFKIAIELLQDFSDYLKNTSYEMDLLSPTPVYEGGSSETDTLKFPISYNAISINDFSRRGVMVSNSASEGGDRNERMYRTNGGVTIKPRSYTEPGLIGIRNF